LLICKCIVAFIGLINLVYLLNIHVKIIILLIFIIKIFIFKYKKKSKKIKTARKWAVFIIKVLVVNWKIS
jgi:hypothetical protein